MSRAKNNRLKRFQRDSQTGNRTPAPRHGQQQQQHGPQPRGRKR